MGSNFQILLKQVRPLDCPAALKAAVSRNPFSLWGNCVTARFHSNFAFVDSMDQNAGAMGRTVRLLMSLFRCLPQEARHGTVTYLDVN